MPQSLPSSFPSISDFANRDRLTGGDVAGLTFGHWATGIAAQRSGAMFLYVEFGVTTQLLIVIPDPQVVGFGVVARQLFVLKALEKSLKVTCAAMRTAVPWA